MVHGQSRKKRTRQNATHDHLPTTPSMSPDPQGSHTAALDPSCLDKQQALPPPDSHNVRSHKRKDRDAIEEDSHEAAKRQRTHRQATAASKAPTSESFDHENIISASDSSSPSSNDSQHSSQQCLLRGSPDRHVKTAECDDFFVENLRRDGPVRRAAAYNALHYLEDLQNLDDLLAVAPRAIFSVSRSVVDHYYNSITIFKNLKFKKNAPTGQYLIGKIGLFVLPLQRADPRRLKKTNEFLLPGPYGTDIIIKLTPGLIITNDNDEHINIKPFTTKHNTDPEKLRTSGKLKQNYVLMRRTPGDNQTEDNPCFASLDFVGTSEVYDYKSSSYMGIDSTYAYPRCGPWLELGYLVNSNENRTNLDKILTEANSRMSTPIREKSGISDANTLASPALSSLSSFAAPDSLPKSPFAAFDNQDLDTVVPKTHSIPADPNADPQRVLNTSTFKLPNGISDMTLIDYFRTSGVTAEQAAAIRRLSAAESGTSQENLSINYAKHVQIPEPDGDSADSLAQNHKSTDTS